MIKYLIDGKIVADKIDNMINSVIDTRRDIANGLLMANQEICKVCIEDRVDAIPVEWIKQWKEKAADGSLYRGPLDLYDHYEYEAAIDRLLSDWEEENETDQPTVEAIPIKDIKDFLRCEKIDTCDWLNCRECSQMKCISIRNLSDLIEWSKERENEEITKEDK